MAQHSGTSRPATTETRVPIGMSSHLHVLYVDHDPVLREVSTIKLEQLSAVESVTPLGSPREALHAPARTVADVDLALLNLDLGAWQINGIELGLALRAPRPELPIIIVSQHAVPGIATLVPAAERRNWAFVRRSTTLDVAEFETIIERTVAGHETVLADAQDHEATALGQLSRRQRQVMALAATGYDAKGIAERLQIGHTSVRSELSKTYRALVPDREPGTNLRTLAVLEYIRLSAGMRALTPP